MLTATPERCPTLQCTTISLSFGEFRQILFQVTDKLVHRARNVLLVPLVLVSNVENVHVALLNPVRSLESARRREHFEVFSLATQPPKAGTPSSQML